jgi:enoyl-CoA hydratase
MSLTASYENLILERREAVALLTINRPGRLNALNAATLAEMSRALDELEADPALRVLIITGAGEKAFVAGADIGELKDLDLPGGTRAAQRGQALLRRLEASRLFVIAAVNGYALGGGLELALACDVRLASETAVLGLPEVGLGIIPGYGGTQRLPRLVGRGRALELVATGRRIDAAEALRIGLVNRVVPPGQLLEACLALADEVLAQGPLAVQAAKRAINKGLEVDLDRGLEIEALEFGKLCATADRLEGMTAFLEKRRPVFRGL